MPESEIITLVIAIYGASLSTIIAIREFTKDRRRVKVECFPVILSTGSNMIMIRVVNTGHRPIQINQAGLLLSNGQSVTQLQSSIGIIPLPKKLEDGESLEIMFDTDRIKQSQKDKNNKKIKFTKAYVSDAEGNRYTFRLPKNFLE